ncbi:MAG: hypothetical protein M0036_24460 [Desulfobacteraceae bacterium]|nr:hypothetical protein [Desulfobacteraceae bacterium]
MKRMPTRDTSGKCVGECKDIVRPADKRRQKEINSLKVESPADYPSVAGAFDRNEPPGYLGGHV